MHLLRNNEEQEPCCNVQVRCCRMSCCTLLKTCLLHPITLSGVPLFACLITLLSQAWDPTPDYGKDTQVIYEFIIQALTFIWLLSMAIYVWKAHDIEYKRFINTNIDPKHVCAYVGFFALATFFSFGFNALNVYPITDVKQERWAFCAFWALIGIGILMTIWSGSVRWWWKQVIRCIAVLCFMPWFGISFGASFVACNWTSLMRATWDLQLSICSWYHKPPPFGSNIAVPERDALAEGYPTFAPTTNVVTCTCDDPSGSSNGYTCMDGTTAYCANTEECYATYPFNFGDWDSGCRPIGAVGYPTFAPTQESNGTTYVAADDVYPICTQGNNLYVGKTLLYTIPYYIKLTQNFYKFGHGFKGHMGWARWKYLLNTSKYAVSLIYVVVATYKKYLGAGVGDPMWMLWLSLVILNSAFKFTWDIFVDWDIKARLRNGGVFPKWYYCLACVLNGLLRTTWTISLSPEGWTIAQLNLLFAWLELMRRGQWNILRVETESHKEPGPSDCNWGDHNKLHDPEEQKVSRRAGVRSAPARRSQVVQGRRPSFQAAEQKQKRRHLCCCFAYSS